MARMPTSTASRATQENTEHLDTEVANLISFIFECLGLYLAPISASLVFMDTYKRLQRPL